MMLGPPKASLCQLTQEAVQLVDRIGAILPTPISPTHAKCDHNNVKQLKLAVQVGDVF